METKVQMLKYSAQEKGAYIVGLLSCHLSMKGAVVALVEQMQDLQKKGWQRTDRGITLEAMTQTKVETRTLHLYSCTFHNSELNRDLQLYIETLIAKD